MAEKEALLKSLTCIILYVYSLCKHGYGQADNNREYRIQADS